MHTDVARVFQPGRLLAARPGACFALGKPFGCWQVVNKREEVALRVRVALHQQRAAIEVLVLLADARRAGVLKLYRQLLHARGLGRG